MLAVAVPKRNKLQNIIVLTPKDGPFGFYTADYLLRKGETGKEQRYIKSNGMLITLVVLTVLPIILGMLLFMFGLFFDTNSFFSLYM